MTDIDTIVQDLKDAQWKSNNEIERLKKYEEMVQFIVNDYHELSYDKAKWQRDDWKKRCKQLIVNDWIDDALGEDKETFSNDDLDF
jgi:hypothetical protein